MADGEDDHGDDGRNGSEIGHFESREDGVAKVGLHVWTLEMGQRSNSPRECRGARAVEMKVEDGEGRTARAEAEMWPHSSHLSDQIGVPWADPISDFSLCWKLSES